MPSPPEERLKLVQGTLDMLVLSVLSWGPQHGHGIATTIRRQSGDAFLVDHGSLYPALQRLEARGLVKAHWGESDTGREARFYRLTPSGRRHLVRAVSRWEQLIEAVGRLTRPAPEQS